jgi:LysR family transcriptional regulator, glycine cleavage system transcriptional activator
MGAAPGETGGGRGMLHRHRNGIMSRRFPPLATLRAFEAAADAGRFAQAAKMLNVTQGAISHQIKTLEAQLGVTLFHRGPQGLTLTAEGKRLAQGVASAFDILAATLDQVRRGPQAQKNTLALTLCSVFAAKWFIPRLGDFGAAHPQILLRVIGRDRTSMLDSGKTDIAVLYGKGEWTGVESTLIHRDVVFPVCSPSLLKGEKPRIEDLALYPLLHDEESLNACGEGPNWQTWFSRAGIVPATESRRPGAAARYAQSSLAIEAAIEGHGIALARGLLVHQDLAAGRLVRPVAESFPAVLDLYFIRSAARRNPAADALRDWLLDRLMMPARGGEPRTSVPCSVPRHPRTTTKERGAPEYAANA